MTFFIISTIYCKQGDTSLNGTHMENSVSGCTSLNSVQEWLLGCF